MCAPTNRGSSPVKSRSAAVGAARRSILCRKSQATPVFTGHVRICSHTVEAASKVRRSSKRVVREAVRIYFHSASDAMGADRLPCSNPSFGLSSEIADQLADLVSAEVHVLSGVYFDGRKLSVRGRRSHGTSTPTNALRVCRSEEDLFL